VVQRAELLETKAFQSTGTFAFAGRYLGRETSAETLSIETRITPNQWRVENALRWRVLMPDTIPETSTSPRPFSDFPAESRKCEPHLRLLVAVGPVLSAGFYSMSHAFAEVQRQLGDEAPSYNTLRLLPQKLARLLRLSFGRDVELYRRVPFGRRVVGLSADGPVVLRLARDYLAAGGHSPS
jgi:hypothetical protein